MGNLTITPVSPMNMSKVTISVWFRIPSATVTAVRARDAALIVTGDDIGVMDHVIPIITWGAQQTATIWDFLSPTASCGPYPGPSGPFTDTLGYVSGSHSAPAQQSFIGVRCRPGQHYLCVHLQPGHGSSCVNSNGDVGPGFSCTFPAELGPDGATRVVHPDVTDSSYIDEGLEEGAVGNSNAARHGPNGGKPNVSLDTWQHLLISWDLGIESCSSVTTTENSANKPYNERISTTSKLYCALNAVNKNGFNLPASWIGTNDGIGDANAVACSSMFYIAGLVYNPDNQIPYVGGAQTAATASITHGSIPAGTIWIPGPLSVSTQSRGTIAANLNIEMAELQIYTDIALNTSVLANRRAFVTSDGKPETDFTIADALMGKSPEIRIRAKTGVNLGTAGDLTKTGTINDYTPGPSL